MSRHNSTIFKNCADKSRGLNLDIDGWLRGIGLEQYEQTFRDNAIDADVLRDLTDEHLRELGLPLGARLKLLRAVAALSTGQTPISPEITTAAPRRRRAPASDGHVLGPCGFDSAVARMDPEDLREIISAYQKCVAETVQRFGGFVAKYMGDGVLITSATPRPTRMTQSGLCEQGWSWSRCRCPEDPRAPTDARRHRNGSGGRR